MPTGPLGTHAVLIMHILVEVTVQVCDANDYLSNRIDVVPVAQLGGGYLRAILCVAVNPNDRLPSTIRVVETVLIELSCSHLSSLFPLPAIIPNWRSEVNLLSMLVSANHFLTKEFLDLVIDILVLVSREHDGVMVASATEVEVNDSKAGLIRRIDFLVADELAQKL